MKTYLLAASLVGAAALGAPEARAGGIDLGVYLDLGHVQLAFEHDAWPPPAYHRHFPGCPHWAPAHHGYGHHPVRHAWRHGYRRGYGHGYRHGYRHGYAHGHRDAHHGGHHNRRHWRPHEGRYGPPARVIRDVAVRPRLAVDARDGRGHRRKREHHRRDH